MEKFKHRIFTADGRGLNAAWKTFQKLKHPDEVAEYLDHFYDIANALGLGGYVESYVFDNGGSCTQIVHLINALELVKDHYNPDTAGEDVSGISVGVRNKVRSIETNTFTNEIVFGLLGRKDTLIPYLFNKNTIIVKPASWTPAPYLFAFGISDTDEAMPLVYSSYMGAKNELSAENSILKSTKDYCRNLSKDGVSPKDALIPEYKVLEISTGKVLLYTPTEFVMERDKLSDITYKKVISHI